MVSHPVALLHGSKKEGKKERKAKIKGRYGGLMWKVKGANVLMRQKGGQKGRFSRQK